MLGMGMASGRSGMDVAKRIIKYISCSGRAAVVAMAAMETGGWEKG